MIPRFFSCLVILFFLILIFPTSTKAANEFSTSYDINYSVSEDGSTLVTENITLKNLTDKYFPSSFTLILPSEDVLDIEASDIQGSLETETSKEGKNTKLAIKFTNQQIIGLGKEYTFNLKFKDNQIARHTGKVWNINIPKISQQTAIDNLSLVLSVPVDFSDPDFISPKAREINESGGKINFSYGKDDLTQTGISAIFGNSQNVEFNLKYQLQNESIFPKFVSIVLPSNSSYQKVFIENIEPRPENAEVDRLGNNLAYFKLNTNQSLEVKVNGTVKSFLNSQFKTVIGEKEQQSFLEETKFWDKNNPNIKLKLTEILEGKNLNNSSDKAREIDKFVSNFLQFNRERISNGDFDRFGSVTTLNNPEKALSSEFVDLEIALLRAADIPSRQVIGFALFNSENKPASFKGDKLHTWIEFYDPEKGWLISDPTWENTTSGADFFAFNDLNHFALGVSSGNDKFILPDKTEIKLMEPDPAERKAAELDVQVNTEILSGFPARAKVKINNLGNITFPASILKVDASKILIETKDSEPENTISIPTPEIPPFGNLEYDFNLKTGAIWHSYQDILQINFAGVDDTRVLTVVPILSYKIFAIEIFGGLIIIFLFYLLTILIHHKSARINNDV